MKSYDAIIQLLSGHGVYTVFTFQSDGNMRLLAKMDGEWSDDFDLIKARHEQGAIAMADGYSRVSDDFCLCTIGRGPAIAQTGTSLVTSRRRGSDFLVVIPETATDAAYDIKGFAQEAYLDSTIENVISIRNYENVIPGVREGLRRLEVGDGPVTIQVSQNVLDGELGAASDFDLDAPIETESAQTLGGHVYPDDQVISEAVDMYLDSDATKPPIILAGRGAVQSEARDSIESLAERMNALLATTVQSRGYFDDHPFYLGFVGHYGGNLANKYVMNSDFVLAVGCGLNPFTSDFGHLFDDGKKVVHVDVDPSVLERYTRVDLGVLGDATTTIEAFEEELRRIEIDRSGEFWTENVRDEIAASPQFDEGDFGERPGTIDPRDLLTYLNRVLPDERTVITDTGHHTRWVLDGIETPTPEQFIWPGEFGSIGLGLPTGIGAALASEDSTCVTFCGDAGFMMASQELETAARYDIPLLVVVMNDSALGTEYHSLLRTNDHADVSLIDTPALAAIAEAMGAEGYTVEDLSDLEAIEDILNEEPAGPIVLDCKVNRDVKHRSKM